MLLTRRRFFSLLPAPLIVSAANIMPVRALADADRWAFDLLDDDRSCMTGRMLARALFCNVGGSRRSSLRQPTD